MALYAQGTSEPQVRLLIPAYQFPGDDAEQDFYGLRDYWDPLIAASRTLPLTVIINPGDGPIAPGDLEDDWNYDRYQDLVAGVEQLDKLEVTGGKLRSRRRVGWGIVHFDDPQRFITEAQRQGLRPLLHHFQCLIQGFVG